MWDAPLVAGGGEAGVREVELVRGTGGTRLVWWPVCTIIKYVHPILDRRISVCPSSFVRDARATLPGF